MVPHASLRDNDKPSPQIIAILSGLAGLFHDFGKANALFQDKIDPNVTRKVAEPYRHEWVSLRLFQAFASGKSDQEWLQALSVVTKADDASVRKNIYRDGLAPTPLAPFSGLAPLAKVVAWLLVSHHKLPVHPASGSDLSPTFAAGDEGFVPHFSAAWNSTHSLEVVCKKQLAKNWDLRAGTPIVSAIWRKHAKIMAQRALQCPELFVSSWLHHRFVSHVSRLTLMLADHHYSAQTPEPAWQDPVYSAYANSDRKTLLKKQKLDEHHIGVGSHAYQLGGTLPNLRSSLPALTCETVTPVTHPRFAWQSEAYNAVVSVRDNAAKHGFFGVNMASTGRGKTLANARIMQGLADPQVGCRFSVALGLRTLTLQTGDALKQRLNLNEEDLAVLIGSAAVQKLHNMGKHARPSQGVIGEPDCGSESLSDPLSEDLQVRYQGALSAGDKHAWLKSNPTLHKLLSAPVLISTIDHLMPAVEGIKGGRQIAPALRLLTSDLILDEPDDFDNADLSALCRLVNWAGMLGSRVLLSSATLPPVFVCALFEAYRAGRAHFESGRPECAIQVPIVCAWFDEFKTVTEACDSKSALMMAHLNFVKCRAERLANEPVLRQAKLLCVDPKGKSLSDQLDALTPRVRDTICQLHQHHGIASPTGRRVSIGLIRMANIDPMIDMSKRLMRIEAPAGTKLHYCVYHSQHPLAVRSAIERKLDGALARHDPLALWQQDEVKRAISEHPECDHIFVVIATSVAEVGRDHDYDWAIAEPSSIRSLIQLSGRIRRHRPTPVTQANFVVLSNNLKGLVPRWDHFGTPLPAYCHPGFERKTLRLAKHDLRDILLPDLLANMTSIPRILQPKLTPSMMYHDLVAFEHVSLLKTLFPASPGAEADRQGWPTEYAARWWLHDVSWCAEMQRRHPFRASRPDGLYCLVIPDVDEDPTFQRVNETTFPLGYVVAENIKNDPVALAKGNGFWFVLDALTVYQHYADEMAVSLNDFSYQFGEIRLPCQQHATTWHYHPAMGLYKR